MWEQSPTEALHRRDQLEMQPLALALHADTTDRGMERKRDAVGKRKKNRNAFRVQEKNEAKTRQRAGE